LEELVFDPVRDGKIRPHRRREEHREKPQRILGWFFSIGARCVSVGILKGGKHVFISHVNLAEVADSMEVTEGLVS
jgi:hypothetical protein